MRTTSVDFAYALADQLLIEAGVQQIRAILACILWALVPVVWMVVL